MAAKDQNKLGKGLDSLLTNFKELDMIEKENMNLHDRIDYLPVNMIHENKNQPRKQFDETKLQELANSIKEYGFINPIVVAPKPQSNYFMIIAGERRFRAAQLLDMSDVPVVIKSQLKPEVVNALALIENIQREDLDPLEEALSLDQLIKDYNCSHEEIASKIGKSRSYITNSLRLLSLPQSIKDAVKSGLISSSHARVIAGLKNPEKHAEYITSNNLSVREAEIYARNVSQHLTAKDGLKPVSQNFEGIKAVESNPKFPRERLNRYKLLNQCLDMGDLGGIEDNLSDAIDMEVTIVDKKTVAELIIKFHSLEDLDFLIQKLAHEKQYFH